MVVPGNLGWRISVIADEVLKDKVKHAHPIGALEMTCPSCQKPLQMNCYRIAEGPFGTRKALHFLCPSCGGVWSVDKGAEEAILASMTSGVPDRPR